VGNLGFGSWVVGDGGRGYIRWRGRAGWAGPAWLPAVGVRGPPSGQPANSVPAHGRGVRPKPGHGLDWARPCLGRAKIVVLGPGL